MADNMRPESMARIATLEQAEAFIAEQVAEGKEERLEVVCRFCGKKEYFTREDADTMWSE